MLCANAADFTSWMLLFLSLYVGLNWKSETLNLWVSYSLILWFSESLNLWTSETVEVWTFFQFPSSSSFDSSKVLKKSIDRVWQHNIVALSAMHCFRYRSFPYILSSGQTIGVWLEFSNRSFTQLNHRDRLPDLHVTRENSRRHYKAPAEVDNAAIPAAADSGGGSLIERFWFFYIKKMK